MYSTPDSHSILNTIDTFLLTFIEDPYPIVNTEGAYLQKPIIAFDSGGVSEFVRPVMGNVVPFYNFDALFEAIDELITSRMYIKCIFIKPYFVMKQ